MVDGIVVLEVTLVAIVLSLIKQEGRLYAIRSASGGGD